MERQPLGRGLSAILGGASAEAAPAEHRSVVTLTRDRVKDDHLVDVARISAGRGQPRRNFDDAQLDELAASIKEQGVIQPLVVVERGGGYELVAGERRLRAAVRAGLEKVPVVVRESLDEGGMLELALVENLQREDLAPLERARAYERLIESHGHTQEQVAKRVGKSRVAVANAVRLLALPQVAQDALDQGLMTEGHARALLGLRTAREQIEAMRKVVRRNLSVRETEELVKGAAQARGNGAIKGAGKRAPTDLEERLTRSLGTKVRLRGSQAKGRIVIEFYSSDELGRLAERLGG